jgi:phage gpG-like protein
MVPWDRAVVSGFADLAATLAELDDVPSRIASDVSEKLTEELRQQFDRGVDPYGVPWKPLLPSTLKRKRGDARILRRADALSSETVASPTSGAGIEITSVDYGQFHQGGTKNMARRAVLPDTGELPPAWLEIIGDATARAFRGAGL